MLCKRYHFFAPGSRLLTSRFRYDLTLLLYPTILLTLYDVTQSFDVHFIDISHFNSGAPPKHRMWVGPYPVLYVVCILPKFSSLSCHLKTGASCQAGNSSSSCQTWSFDINPERFEDITIAAWIPTWGNSPWSITRLIKILILLYRLEADICRFNTFFSGHISRLYRVITSQKRSLAIIIQHLGFILHL